MWFNNVVTRSTTTILSIVVSEITGQTTTEIRTTKVGKYFQNAIGMQQNKVTILYLIIQTLGSNCSKYAHYSFQLNIFGHNSQLTFAFSFPVH